MNADAVPLQPADLFDMDHTLVGMNTSQAWVRWQRRHGLAPSADVVRGTWMLAQYLFGVLDVEALAERAAAKVAGRSEAELRERVRDFARAEVLPRVSVLARRTVEEAKARGRPCAILTTATSYMAEPVAAELGIEHVLATHVEVEDGRFTGKLVPPLCYGAHKVTVAERWAARHGVDLAQSTFYSDSISDLPMLERVGAPFVVNPDPRLRWAARRRGWPVLRW